MKKLIISIVAFMLCGLVGKAQVYDFLSVGPQFPMGDFNDSYKVGMGTNNAIKMLVGKHSALGLNLGLSRFNCDVADGKIFIVPITALYEYHFSKSPSLYLGMDLGGYYSYSKLTINGSDEKTSKFNFGFAPTIGYTFDPFFINLKYNYLATESTATTWLSLNIGMILNIQGW